MMKPVNEDDDEEDLLSSSEEEEEVEASAESKLRVIWNFARGALGVFLLVGAVLFLGWLWSAAAPLRLNLSAPAPHLAFAEEAEGVLKNGVRYHLVRYAAPRGLVTTNVRVNAGSLQEVPGGRGYAHFLEHMAFGRAPASNLTSRNSIFAAFEALGGGYNAFTSFSQTVYQTWDVPAGAVERVLDLHRIQVSEAQLDVDVELEVGAILGEARYSNASRIMWNTHFDGCPITRHWTIGWHSDIAAASAIQLQNFRKQHYRPSNMEVYVVGDIDVKAVQSYVEKTFGTLSSPSSSPWVGESCGKSTKKAVLLREHVLGSETLSLDLILSRALPLPSLTRGDLWERLMDTMFSRYLSSALASVAGAKVDVQFNELDRDFNASVSGLSVQVQLEHEGHLSFVLGSLLSHLNASSFPVTALWPLHGARSPSSQQVASTLLDSPHYYVTTFEWEPSLKPVIEKALRHRGLQLLHHLKNAVLANDCTSASFLRCTLSLSSALPAGSAAALTMLRTALSGPIAPPSSSRIPLVADTSGRFARLMKQATRPTPVIRPRRPLARIEGASSPRAPALYPALHQVGLARLAVIPHTSQWSVMHLQVSALNIRYGALLCPLLARVHRFKHHFAAPGRSFQGHMLPYSMACRGQHLVVSFSFSSSSAATAEAVVAAMQPMVSAADAEEWTQHMRRASEEEREEASWRVFASQLSSNLTLRAAHLEGVSSVPMTAQLLQSMLLHTLAPSNLELSLVGASDPTVLRFVEWWDPLLRYQPPSPAPPPLSTLNSTSTHACELPNVQHAYDRTETALALRMPICLGLHPSFYRELLYWKMFLAMRSFGSFSYYCMTRVALLPNDEALVTLRWLQGNDWPSQNTNRSRSVEAALASLRTPLDKATIWDPVYLGWRKSLPQRLQTHQFYLDALESFFRGHRLGPLNQTAPVNLDCFSNLALDAEYHVGFLEAVPATLPSSNLQCSG